MSYGLQPTRYPYLFRRGATYYFRKAFPQLSGKNKQHDVCMSLKTSDINKARIRAFKFEALMNQSIKANPTLSNPEVRELLHKLARQVFTDCVEDLNEDLVILKQEAVPQYYKAELESHERLLRKMQKNLHSISYDDFDVDWARSLLEEDLGLHTYPEVQNELVTMIRRAQMEQQRLFIAHLKGNFEDVRIKDELFTGIDLQSYPTEASYRRRDGTRFTINAETPLNQPLQEAIEKYLKAKSSNQREAKTVDDIRFAIGLFTFVNPDVQSVKDITKVRINDFFIHLGKIPTNMNKQKRFTGMNYEQVIAENKNGPCLSSRTRTKYTVTFNAFVKWLQQYDYLPPMEIPKLEKIRNKGKQAEKPGAFTDEELKILFTYPQYTGHKPNTLKQKFRTTKGDTVTKDAYYWVPLVALFSGMRLGEIIQLNITDIKVEDGIKYFDVTETTDAEENDLPPQTEKRLKTEASRRKVPIHPRLIELGFLEYVDVVKSKGYKRVFEEVKVSASGVFSKIFSQYFGRILRILKIKTKRTCFHSFRHTFVTAARNQHKLSKSEVRAIIGHDDNESTLDIYTGDVSLKDLNVTLCQITHLTQFTTHLKPYKK